VAWDLTRTARPPYWPLPPEPKTYVTEPNLFVICAAAFVAVLSLLSLLAGLIRVLTALFPAPEAQDAALIAAIATAATRAHPGTRVTNIQENR
jgi:hypothetical protein